MTVRLSHRATQGMHKLSAVVEELHACTTARYIKADWTFQNVTLSPADAGSREVRTQGPRHSAGHVDATKELANWCHGLQDLRLDGDGTQAPHCYMHATQCALAAAMYRRPQDRQLTRSIALARDHRP